jgi:hypothetical protein
VVQLEMQKNKATEGHLAVLKSKLAKLRREQLTPSSSGGGKGRGFDVTKVRFLFPLKTHVRTPFSPPRYLTEALPARRSGTHALASLASPP